MKTILLPSCVALFLGTTLVSCNDAPPPPPPPPQTKVIHHYDGERRSENPEDFKAITPPHSSSQ